MYSEAQYQAYQPFSNAFDPNSEDPPVQYPNSELQSVLRPERSFQQSMPYPPNLPSEAPPPYAEVDFQPQTQHIYRNEQRYLNSPPTRNQPNPNPNPNFRSGTSYSAEKCENLVQTNPFRTPTHTAEYHNLSNGFNRIRSDRYHAENSIYGSSSRPSPLPASSRYAEPEYLQHRPQTPLGINPSIASKDSDTPSEHQILLQSLAFTHAPPPPSNSIPPLSRPIAIPQTIPGGGQAFARAWAPSLSAHGIAKSEFLAFIDGLNIVSTANPPLQVLNLAGGLLGMVPYHWAAIAGLAIQASAKLGTAAVSKGRTEMYMKEANEKFFAPKRLKVVIASRDAVGAVVGLPRDGPTLALLTRENISMGMVERSLEVMRGYAADLDFDVPPPAEQTTMLEKMSARQIVRQGEKNEKKMLKKREKIVEREERGQAKMLEKDEKESGRGRRSDSDSDTCKEEESKPKSRRELKHEKRAERKEQRREGKAEKQSEKRHGKKIKDNEAEKARKLLWILIENL